MGKGKALTRRFGLSVLAGLCLAAQPVVKAAQSPDLTGIWYHIRHKQIDLANAEYQRLQYRYPDWQPEETLKQAMSLLNKPERKVALKPEPQPRPDNSDAIFMGRLALMKEAQWQALSDRAMKKAESIALEGGDDKQRLLVGWIHMSRQAFHQALMLFSRVSEGAQKQKHDAIAAAIDALSFQAVKANDGAALASLLSRYPRQVTPLVTGAAWQAFEAAEYKRAETLFKLVRNDYGQVLSLSAQGHDDEATSIACDAGQRGDVVVWCNNALARQQVAFYDKKDFKNSLAKAEQLIARNAINAEQRALYGWALDASGRENEARQVFLSLLAEFPNDETIQAAVIHTHQYEASALAPLAGKYPFIATFITQQDGELAWRRKQFDVANRYGVMSAKEIEDSNMQVYGGFTTRHRSGERGLGHLDEQASYLGMSDTFKDTRVDVALRYENVFSGTPASGAWFGQGLTDDSFDGDAKQNGEGVAVSLTHQQSDVTWYGNLGYLLVDQPVSTRLTCALGATWFQDDTLISLLGYRQRRKDSVLSQTGTWEDTISRSAQNAWGGVLQNGIKGLLVVNINNDWAVSASPELAIVEGEKVKDNRFFGLRLEVSRALGKTLWDGFDYFRLSPYVSWQQYDDNLSGFTVGQGGYFSPQSFFNTGISAQWLTLEAKRWQVSGRVSAGWSSIRQDDEPRYPLSETSTSMLPGSKETGLNADIFLEGQYQLSDHWAIAGYVSRSHAVAYQATYAGLEIRWHAANRRGLTSDTLIGSSPELKGFAF